MERSKTKFIFVTGGVVSSLGKGLASASLGALIEARGLRVTLLKMDPYINVDPGTMSPLQHGEVFVTDEDADLCIVEVGGTVGDIESLPFLEAIREFRWDLGRENVVYVHLTLVPFIPAAGELKTKPTQHSVKELTGLGIQPDILLCRCDRPLEKRFKAKIANFYNVVETCVISAQAERR